MSGEAMSYVRAQNIKPIGLKYYMERIAARVDNETGLAKQAKQSYLAEELSVSPRTVRKLQDAAIEKGYLLVANEERTGEKGRFIVNHYQIPGFMEYLAAQKQGAREIFERTVGTRGASGQKSPEEGVGPTDRRNTGGLRTGGRRRASPYGRSWEEDKEDLRTSDDVQGAAKTFHKEEAPPFNASPSEPEATEKTGCSAGSVKPKRRTIEYAADFVAFFSAYKQASPRSPGSKEEAAALFRKLSDTDRTNALAMIPTYIADCARDLNGRGRPPKDAVRYLRYKLFNDMLEQHDAEATRASEQERAQQLQIAKLAVGGNWTFAEKLGWRTLADFPAWIMEKLNIGQQEAYAS